MQLTIKNYKKVRKDIKIGEELFQSYSQPKKIN